MNSNKNINPTIWGAGAWKFIHSIALGYPNNPSKDDNKNYYTFFSNLQNVLPCEKCSQKYKQNLKEYPLEEALKNTDNLF